MAMEVRPVALITGGARRVGAAVARRLARAGFNIGVTYLSGQSEADELIREIESHGLKAIAIRADLLKPAETVPAIAHQMLTRFGRLDFLLNNASLYRAGDLRDTQTNDVIEMMSIHFYAPLLLCRAFEKQLRAARGLVVNMVDATAQKPGGKYLAYTASKAALANLTLALARELAPEVRVNGIAPGVVEWPADFPMNQRETYLKRVPLGRAGTPEDVAELAAFLVGGGKYITGQIIMLDGGRSIV
jgi:pteridine reductase